jgi:uncharacterized membrane protein YbjE (DUF340 family)
MLLISITFIFGIAVGILLGGSLQLNVTPVIATLLFLVGFSVGGDRESLKKSFSREIRHYLLPMLSLVGSVLGGLVIALFLKNISVRDAFLTALGMGYYSVPSILVTTKVGIYSGTLLLITNILREVITLIWAPYLSKVFDGYAPIVVGGATTMDVSLPIISKSSGKEFIVPSFINGFILTLTIPFIISLVISIM